MIRQEDMQDFLRKMSAPDEVKKVEFPAFNTYVPQEHLKVGLQHIDNVQVIITAQLGQTTMKIRDIINLNEGSIIELDQIAGENACILVNDQRLGTGGLVVIGNNFGVRVESIDQMGKDLIEVDSNGQRNINSSD